MSAEVEQSRFKIVCMYVHVQVPTCVTHIKRLDPSNGRNFESDKEQVDVTKITDTLCKLKAS